MADRTISSEHLQLFALEVEPGGGRIDRDFVISAPTGGAIIARLVLQAGEHAFHRKVSQAVDLQEIANLIDRAVVCDQFFTGGKINAIKAGMANRWAADAQVNFLCTARRMARILDRVVVPRTTESSTMTIR